MKANHIKESIHFEGTCYREGDEIKVGDHVYLAHLPYSIMVGYMITKKEGNKFIMDGRPISADHPALYKSKNEAIDEMVRQLMAIRDLTNESI